MVIMQGHNVNLLCKSTPQNLEVHMFEYGIHSIVYEEDLSTKRLELAHLAPLLTIFQLYIVRVSVIAGGNRRKLPTSYKSLTNFIT